MTRATYPFEVRSRDVWRIALPASVAFITEPLVGIVDITIIGRLGDAGMLAGLVLGALIFDFLFSLAYFLRIGTAGLTAQAVGARDPRDGLLHAARSIVLAVVLGVLMVVLAGPILWLSMLAMAPGPGATEALATYFHVRVWSAPLVLVNYALLGWFYGRAEATTGMALQFIIHGVNILASVYFVYGLGWGVAGAALGTVLGQVAAALAGLFLLARHYGGARTVLQQLRPGELLQTAALRRLVGLNRDLMIRSIALMAAYGWFAAQGSRMGEVALSGNAILLNLLMVAGFFMDGIAQAAEQLTGKAVGANWRPAFDRAYVLSFRWGVVIAIGLGLVWWAAAEPLIGLMTTSPEVRAYALSFLWLAVPCALTFMPAFVYDGILIGVTLNAVMRDGMLVSLGVFLAAALLLQPPLGNAGLWLALHLWFLARGGYYWWAIERRKAALFA